ncbi:MAG: hypothetical protein IJX78_05385 [Bacilli bacterium]|nr:hypothetical protein [Bacilli bacterium]
MIEEYTKELNELPKGSITKKYLKNNYYYYLTYRNNSKVITKYLGKDNENIIKVKEQLLRRKQIEHILKKLNEEKNKINKMEMIL